LGQVGAVTFSDRQGCLWLPPQSCHRKQDHADGLEATAKREKNEVAVIRREGRPGVAGGRGQAANASHLSGSSRFKIPRSEIGRVHDDPDLW